MANSYSNRYLAQRPMVLGLAKILFLALTNVPIVRAAPIHIANLLWALEEDEEGKPADDPSLWIYLAVAMALVLLGGVFAGLTIALMGQDEIYLQVIKDSGEGKEKTSAGKVLRLLKAGKHWVLVTLLLSNVITNETLPIVLDRSLGGGWPAVLGSTVLIVIFGEIVPQSICVRYGLPIGAWMSPFVLVLMYIMAPVAWPTAKLLDYLLGEDHGTMYKKAGLKTLVSLHRTLGDAGQRLHPDEVTIISAVLDLKDKSVGSIMTPMDDVFTLSLDDVLDEDTMDDILSQGYSRVPIHHPDNDENFVGMLLVKMLITYDPEDAKPVRDFALATLPETLPQTSCLDIVNFFQEGKSHMVMVSNHPGEDHGALGVVTLEDVIEELIGEEIIDESDVFVDIHKAIRRLAPAPRIRLPKPQEKVAQKIIPPADLIDISEGEAIRPADLHRASTTFEVNSHRGSIPGRRLSDNSKAGDMKAVRRGQKFEEVREHLKHIGPSNLASNPKDTRYATIKVKPGLEDGVPRKESPAGRISPHSRRISAGASDFTGGIGEGLVQSGGKAASDGVQALAHGYGTLSNSQHDKRPQSSSAHKATQADPADLNGSAGDEDQSTPTGRPKMRTNNSEDTIGDLPSRPRSRSPYFNARTPARSGSITENIIDTNGIRKVVLETTSSSDSNEDEANLRGEGIQASTSPSRAGHRQTETEQDHHNVTQADQHASKRKKKKRKKGKNSSETAPLLGHS